MSEAVVTPIRRPEGYLQKLPELNYCLGEAYRAGIFRQDSRVLDIGCGDPWAGLFRALVEFNWRGAYVGVDDGIEQEWRLTAEYENQRLADRYANRDDPSLTPPHIHGILDRNIDDPYFELPLSRRNPRMKQIAAAFAVRTLDNRSAHVQENLIREMQRTSVQVVVLTTNERFRGDAKAEPNQGVPIDLLKSLDFDRVSGINFTAVGTDGRLELREGKPEKCAEVFGLWLDGRARVIKRPSAAPRQISFYGTEKGIRVRRTM